MKGWKKNTIRSCLYLTMITQLHTNLVGVRREATLFSEMFSQRSNRRQNLAEAAGLLLINLSHLREIW